MYDCFVKSFQKHWLDHKESCDKYVSEHAGPYAGVFMVDNTQEGNLSMCCQNPVNGLPDRIRGYALSLDNNLLQWIAENAGYVKYVVFGDCFGHDVVSVARIPVLIARNGCDYDVYDMPGVIGQYVSVVK